MKRYFVMCLFLILPLVGMASEREDEVLFKGSKKGIQVEFAIRDSHYVTCVKRGANILLEREHDMSVSERRAMNPLLVLIDFWVEDDYLLLFYDCWGEVYMEQWSLEGITGGKMNQFLLGQHRLMSYENFGGIVSAFSCIRIGGELYFYISASQQLVGNSVEDLFVFRGGKLNRLAFPDRTWKTDYRKQKPEGWKEDIKAKKRIDLSRHRHNLEAIERVEVMNEVAELLSASDGVKKEGIRLENYMLSNGRSLSHDILHLFVRDAENRLYIVRYECTNAVWLQGDYKLEEVLPEGGDE